MKKLFLIGASLFSILTVQSVYSQNAFFGGGCCSNQCCTNNCCPQQDCCEEATNDCWCKYVRYEPRYYNTYRCVQEQIPCTKKCCRWNTETYEVQRCRMVPEYYTETKCRQVPEYYDVPDCKYCTKKICEPQCEWIPRYYWKHSCGPTSGCCN